VAGSADAPDSYEGPSSYRNCLRFLSGCRIPKKPERIRIPPRKEGTVLSGREAARSFGKRADGGEVPVSRPRRVGAGLD